MLISKLKRGRNREMLSLCCKFRIQSHNYLRNVQRFLLYSTASQESPNQFFSNYLIDHLGFSHQQALSISTKNKVNDLNFPHNANSIINFLNRYGFDNTHIKKIVSCYPQILAADVDETLKPQFNFLQEQGFSGSNLSSVVDSNPSIVGRQWNPIILNLTVILGNVENLIKLFKQSNRFTTPSALQNIVSNVEFLRNEYGVSIDAIRKGVLVQTACFVRKPEFFRSRLDMVEQELGIPRLSKMFFYGMHLLFSSTQVVESKCQLFKSFGWTEHDVSSLIRKSPSVFLPSEQNLKKKLAFLMTEMGYDPGFLTTHSALFTYSLQSRILPRHRVLLVLKEKGLLDYNLYSATIIKETLFLKKFIEPFKELVPDLLDIYQNIKCRPKLEAISSRC